MIPHGLKLYSFVILLNGLSHLCFISSEVINTPSLMQYCRLISSYLHLLLNPSTPKRYRTYLTSVQKNVSWESFVIAVTTEKDRWSNIHWDRQTDFCGFHKFGAVYNFVGNYEFLREHSEKLSSMANISNYSEYY